MKMKTLLFVFLYISLGKCDLEGAIGSNLHYLNSKSERIYPYNSIKSFETGIKKRQVHGGVNNVSTSDPTIVDLARSSLVLFDGSSDHSNKYKLIEITSATQQVVAGISYNINVLIAPSDCAKTDSKPAHECNSLAGGKSESCEISIWDRSWLPQGRETTFKCGRDKEQKLRSKRQVLGDASNVSTSDPTIVDLARSSLALLDGTSDHSNKLKVIEITSASEQVVAGTLYKINVLIAPSDCAKTDSKPAHECNSLAGSKSESCEISIWDRPWLPQGRETTFKCESRTEQKFRSKRQVVGGASNVSTSDPTIVDLARSSLALLDGTSDHSNKLKVIEITSASEQVVAGTLYKINVLIAPSDCAKTDSKPAHECNSLAGGKSESCEISIWDRPWLPQGRETTFKCGSRTEQKFRSKRQVLGGASNISTSDPTIVDLARSSLALLDGTSDHSNKLKVIEITSASEQVVAGTLYKINVLIAPSDCAKTDSKPAHECNSLAGGKSESCEISIWDRPWLPQGRETTFKCGSRTEQKFRSRRSTALVGGVVPVSSTDRNIAELVEHTLTKLDEQTTLDHKYKLAEIANATSQVVEGSLYNIEVKIVPSDCLKTDTKARSECGILKDNDPQLCQIKIWDRLWLPNGREINVICDQTTYNFVEDVNGQNVQ